mmetsp:Transcript_34033/g.89339  ORF Transcript_34033/g.89339 Transcript_34033/m.89339 type:complete len:240 (-) Transcript_34033:3847-4566(-)
MDAPPDVVHHALLAMKFLGPVDGVEPVVLVAALFHGPGADPCPSWRWLDLIPLAIFSSVVKLPLWRVCWQNAVSPSFDWIVSHPLGELDDPRVLRCRCRCRCRRAVCRCGCSVGTARRWRHIGRGLPSNCQVAIARFFKSPVLREHILKQPQKEISNKIRALDYGVRCVSQPHHEPRIWHCLDADSLLKRMNFVNVRILVALLFWLFRVHDTDGVCKKEENLILVVTVRRPFLLLLHSV